jgi:hypothetical protein
MFRPKTPIQILLNEIRQHCDQVALNVLERILTREATQPEIVVSHEQKQTYLDMWANMVFVAGAKLHKGKAKKLCLAALEAERDRDLDLMKIQLDLSELFNDTHRFRTPEASNVHVYYVASKSLGVSDIDVGSSGIELVSCLRAIDFIASRYDF